MTLGREWDLPELLLPSPFPWTTTTELVGKSLISDECSIKEESGTGRPGTSSPRALSVAVEDACRGTTRRSRRGSKKRAHHVNKDDRRYECRKRRREQHSTSSLVTSVPDFDGYQWRKYGQKQIEGAMYQRSYYRCIRSAEQGCPAKRTVQRNDDHGTTTTMDESPKYTVVYMAEHTCAANDSMAEAPVILETTAVATTAANDIKRSSPARHIVNTADASAGSSITSSPPPPTTTNSAAAAGTTTDESSPATSEVTWSSSANNKEYHDLYNDDDGLFAAVDDRSSVLVHQDMDDFTGPIRSPVHVAAGGWTTMMDQCLLHLLVNDPTTTISHFSAGGFSSFF